MKAFTPIIAALIMLTTIHGSACAARDQQQKVNNVTGVLIESSPPITFTSPQGTAISAVIGTELKPGTKVIAGAGGNARIMMMDGTIIAVPSGKQYIVGTVTENSENRTVMRGITVALNEAADVPPPKSPFTAAAEPKPKAEPRVHGMVKRGGPLITQQKLEESRKAKKPVAPRKKLEAIYPNGTAIILAPEITFRWNMALDFADPVLVFIDAGGAEKRIPITSQNPHGTAVSSKELGLKRGQKYGWYLASKNDKPGRARSRRFNFTVLTEQMEQQLAKDVKRIDDAASSKDGQDFLKGQLYFNYGMNYNMVETLLPLWKKNRSTSIKKLLLLGYSRMGRAEEAWRYK